MYSNTKANILSSRCQRNALTCMRCVAERFKSFTASKKKCLYDVLEVSQYASKRDIRSAFVAKTKELHPDKNINDPDLHDQFIEVNEAYSILRNALKRRQYDESKSNVTYVKYNPVQTSHENPFGNTRSNTGKNYYDSEHEYFYSSHPYTKHNFRVLMMEHHSGPSANQRTQGSNDSCNKSRWSIFLDYQFAQEKYKGDKKSGNNFFISVVLAFMVSGAGASFVFINYMRKRAKKYEEKVHLESSSIYETVREQARLNGPRKQLQLLASNQITPESTRTSLATNNA